MQFDPGSGEHAGGTTLCETCQRSSMTSKRCLGPFSCEPSQPTLNVAGFLVGQLFLLPTTLTCFGIFGLH